LGAVSGIALRNFTRFLRRRQQKLKISPRQ